MILNYRYVTPTQFRFMIESKMIKPTDFLLIISIAFLLCKLVTSQSVMCVTNYNKTTTNDYTFQSNLETLLDDLVYRSSSSGFHRSTTGHTTNQVYGLYLCRGDITLTRCHDCVGSARSSLSDHCPSSKAAITYRETCMLRYANYSIFSRLDTRETILECGNWVNSSNPEKFNRTLEGMVEELIEEAVSNNTASFGTMEVSLDSEDGTLYGLAQCTPDLGRSNCSACLRRAFEVVRESSTCAGSLDATASLPSCQLRYDNASFYELGAASSTAPVVSRFFRSVFEGGRVRLSWFVVLYYLVWFEFLAN